MRPPAAYINGIAPTRTAAAALPQTKERRIPARSTIGPARACATT
jgi:hypothetical protein